MNVDRIPSASKGPQGDRRAPSSHRDTLRVCPSHLAQHTQRGFWAPCRCRPDAGRPSPSQRSRQEIRAKTSSTLNRRRQRVQTSALDRGHSRGRVSPKPRDAEVILTGRGNGVLLPQPDSGRGDCRGRGESRNRSRLGQAARVRTRLRPGHQPEGLRGTIEGDAPLAEPRAPRGGALRHRKGHECGLAFSSQPHEDTPAAIDLVLVNGDPNPDRPDPPHY